MQIPCPLPKEREPDNTGLALDVSVSSSVGLNSQIGTAFLEAKI